MIRIFFQRSENLRNGFGHGVPPVGGRGGFPDIGHFRHIDITADKVQNGEKGPDDDTNIRDVENRKTDETKIDKIRDGPGKKAVDEIADGAAHEKGDGDIEIDKTLVLGKGMKGKGEARDDDGGEHDQNHVHSPKQTEGRAGIQGKRKMQHPGNQRNRVNAAQSQTRQYFSQLIEQNAADR